MLVFPITDGAESDCCRFEELPDGAVCLRFRQLGAVRRDLTVVSEPEPGEYALLDSFISGGNYRGFLEESMERFNGRVCLWLRAQAYLFPLPCPSGIGTSIDLPHDQSLFRYSESLLCLWRIEFSAEGALELADCARSLRDKYRLAEKVGIPILIAEREILDIVKAPCEQGA